jgi:Sugar phosphate permease
MKKQGLYTVLAAVAIQLTLGIAYIWSVFQSGVADSIFGGDNAGAGFTFSLLIALMCIGSVISGKLVARFSTAPVVFAGGIITTLGFFLASFVTADCAWLLWVTYGAMGGFGIGFSYSTTIACAQKWYPHKKGLVTGIIVSALGFGGVVFTPIVEIIISNFGGTGVGEPKAFMVLSAVFLVVCSVGSLFIKDAPEGYLVNAGSSNVVSSNAAEQKPVKSFTTSEMLKTPQFYLLTITFLFSCMGGLMMIGFAKPIAVAKGLAATATIGVLAISMFNSIGRLFWGAMSDKLGQINTLIILLIITAVLSLLVNSVNGYLIYVLIACIGFSYGGLLSTFPALTADLFGAKHMAINYGFVLLGFGAGAIISGQIAGYYKNIASSDISLMFPAFVIASCCAVAGIIMMVILKKIQK